MVWSGGDWKAALQPDGSFNGEVAPDVLQWLDGYVRFSGAVMIALGCSWAPWDWDDCVEEYLGKAISAALGPFFKLIFEAIRTSSWRPSRPC